ncbi:MAG: amino acid ABC transporter substrate-binding protein [Smithella sp.]
MGSLIKIFNQMFTGKDNRTIDIGRVLWAQISVGYMFLSGYSVYNGNDFDAVAWGTGAAAILGAGGAALGLKSNTEPDKKDE